MSQQLLTNAFCAGNFATVSAAERAIAGLLAAGFAREDLGIICPKEFEADFSQSIRRETTPAASAPSDIAVGASVGAALGGVAVAATAIATGGVGLLPAAMALVGGGAIAGGFSNLITSTGYRSGFNEYFAHAHQSGHILVGVHLHDDAQARYRQVAAILRECGASSILPEDDPTV